MSDEGTRYEGKLVHELDAERLGRPIEVNLSPEALLALRKLLVLAWRDGEFRYEELGGTDHRVCTREEHAAIVRWLLATPGVDADGTIDDGRGDYL